MLGVEFHANSVYLGAARTTPRISRRPACGSSLKATDRALEVLDLLQDLLKAGELLRGVTDRVLPLSGVRELLGGIRIRCPCHRVSWWRLGAA
jgi:hypothetical protein